MTLESALAPVFCGKPSELASLWRGGIRQGRSALSSAAKLVLLRQVGAGEWRDQNFGRGGAVRRWGPTGKPSALGAAFLGHYSLSADGLVTVFRFFQRRRVRRRSTCCLNSRTGRISQSVKTLPLRENETSKDARLPAHLRRPRPSSGPHASGARLGPSQAPAPR